VLRFEVDDGMHARPQDAHRYDPVIPLGLTGRLNVPSATAWAPAGETREEFMAIQSRNDPSVESTVIEGFIAFETVNPRGSQVLGT